MTTRVCSKCKVDKPLDGFYPNIAAKSGYQSQCKACMKAYRDANRDRLAAYQRQWNANLSDEARARKLASTVAWQKDGHYGKPPGWYDEQLESQGGVCMMCSEPPGARRLHVDHDHACCPGIRSCGRCVRGLLCAGCNTKLGAVEDAEWMAAAGNYLDRFKKRAAA